MKKPIEQTNKTTEQEQELIKRLTQREEAANQASIKEVIESLNVTPITQTPTTTTNPTETTDIIAEETDNFEWTHLIKTADKDYQKGDYKALHEYIRKNACKKSGYEIVRGACIPYYDIDIEYGNGEDSKTKQEQNIYEDYKTNLSKIQDLFPEGRIYTFTSCGFSPSKQVYKNSFHFRVRGVGYYSCGLNIPRYIGIDDSVYKKVGAQQKIRLPFCDKDGDGRFLLRCEIMRGKFTIYKTVSEASKALEESYKDYLITNITGEKFIKVSSDKPIKQRKEWINISTLEASKDESVTIEQINDLAHCLIPDGKQNWDWQFFRNFVWSMSQITNQFNIDTCDIARQILKTSEKFHENDFIKLYELDPSKYYGAYGIGWICNQCITINPDGYNLWRKKYKISPNYECFSDFRRIMKEPYVELRDIIEWAKNCITIIDDGGSHYYLTKNISIADPTKPDIREIYYKEVKKEELLKSLKVFINFKKTEETPTITNTEDQDNDEEPGEKTTKKTTKTKKVVKKVKDETDKFNVLNNAVEWIIMKGILPSYNKRDFIPYGANEKPIVIRDVFNIFNGFRIANHQPKDQIKIEDTLFFKHVKEQLCAGREIEFEYVMNWFAHMIQKPRELACVGLIFISDQGNGKDILASLIEKIIGENHYLSVENVDSFFTNFNSRQEGRLLIKLNELAEGGALSKNHNRYKGEMTKLDIWIEPKCIDAYKVNHYARYLHFSQHRNSITVERSDRRFFIVDCKNDYVNKQDYFGLIRDELNNSDIVYAWYLYFKNRDISKAKIQACPQTNIKNSLKASQMPSSLRYLINLVNNELDNEYNGDGEAPLKTDFKYSGVDLYDSYKAWCESERESIVRKSVFDNWLQDGNLGLEYKQRKINGENKKGYAFTTSSLEELFRKYLKIDDFKIIE